MTGIDLLATILSVTLVVFLIVAIALAIYLIRLVRQVQTIMNEAESTVDLIKSSIRSLARVGLARGTFNIFSDLLSRKGETRSKGKQSK